MPDRDEEFIATLRRGYEAFNRGDFDAAIAIAHPEMEWNRPAGQGPVSGAAAFRAWMAPEAFDEQRIDPVEFRVNGNRVLVEQHVTARGAASGIELDMHDWAIWTLNDDGLVTQVDSYLPHQKAEALEAAGISD